MAGTTPISGLRYAELTDPPSALTGFKNLADDLDDMIIPRFTTAGNRDLVITAPVQGMYADVAGVGLTRYNGTAWQTIGASASIQFVSKSALTNRNTTTTLADDPDLTLPYTSGLKYMMTACLLVSSASATPDFKVAFGFSSSQTFSGAGVGMFASTSAFYGLGSTPSAGAAFPLGEYECTGSPVAVMLHGLWTASSSGTCAVKWAQNTSNATNTTLNAGSWLRLDQLP